VDLPKDIMNSTAKYEKIGEISRQSYQPVVIAEQELVNSAVSLLETAERPIVYSGGGVINSGSKATKLLTELAKLTGFPVTNTLMGLGGYPGNDEQFVGMLGMHGTYEANMAMHECDVMLAVGARFDDRVTGKLQDFAPHAQIVQIDIDKSSINKNVPVDIALLGDAATVLGALIKTWKKKGCEAREDSIRRWWEQINAWRAIDCLRYDNSSTVIKPQYAIERLHAHTKDRDVYFTTEVGQHQMWAAQYLRFDEPKRWMTSGGLGTMGYGFPAATGVQIAHPESLVIDVAGEASFLMNMQELSTVKQYRLPIKVFILNNEYMGMVRQWQEFFHGGRYSESYTDSLPDFVALAEAYGIKGLRAKAPGEVDGLIEEMINHDGPVVADVLVEKMENVFPMIPAGAGHHEMKLGADDDVAPQTTEGAALV